MRSNPDVWDASQALKFFYETGRVCAVGQHRACGGADDVYESSVDRGKFWICACDCHKREKDEE